jgi:hypothetical protein
MKAPKYPIYIVTILFVTGMLISPWLENKFLIWGLIIIPFFGALFKKYRPLVYLVFLPLGSIHHQQFYRLSKSNYSHFTTNGNEKTLLVQLVYPSLFWLVFDREYGLGGPYGTEYSNTTPNNRL